MVPAEPNPSQDSPHDGQPQTAPPAAPVLANRVLRCTAAGGDPFGVGRIEILFGDDERPILYPDQLILLRNADNRTRFHSSHTDYVDGDTAAPWQARRLTVYFLFLGRDPLDLSVSTPQDTLVAGQTVLPANDANLRSQLMTQWWQAYRARTDQLTGPAQYSQLLLGRALARRLSLDMPPYPGDSLQECPLAAIEQQFERSISTLLGIDSLLLAVPQPGDRREDAPRQVADKPLPPPIGLRAVEFAGVASRGRMEPLAYRVPQSCFYLRCGSLHNYAWLRDFLEGWKPAGDCVLADIAPAGASAGRAATGHPAGQVA